MLSYQHKYHVGNHADVLKHLCWIIVIRYLNKKEKPYTLIDSHAGEGVYTLFQGTKHESYDGALKMIAGNEHLVNSHLDFYKELLRHHLKNKLLPGSPAVAAQLMRQQDCMHCIELHPQADIQLRYFAKNSQAQINCHKRDAFEGLAALVPPKVKRGAILIDPPYEQLTEYNSAKITIDKVRQRWTTCQILLWVPLLSKRAGEKSIASENLINYYRREKANGNAINIVELKLTDNEEDHGMYGSCIIAINPCWQFEEQVTSVLPHVVEHLGTDWQWSIS